MKVIKLGKLPEETTYRVICGHCKSVIEYQQKEGRADTDPRASATIIVFKCGVCDRDIYTSRQ